MNFTWIDWVGYSASVFLIISFLINDIKNLRFINLIGCILFVIYGIAIGKAGIPVMIPNAILCFIQIYHLYKLSKTAK
ncbi:MAG: uroporphyrinogen decarboxylase [Flavobacteriaceae bacterium]|jgi:uncharacterized protein with PQ loop repeat|nr:uroporphyrinogen decarboxylase [Flavobacteriaceae bacterium]